MRIYLVYATQKKKKINEKFEYFKDLEDRRENEKSCFLLVVSDLLCTQEYVNSWFLPSNKAFLLSCCFMYRFTLVPWSLCAPWLVLIVLDKLYIQIMFSYLPVHMLTVDWDFLNTLVEWWSSSWFFHWFFSCRILLI